MLQSDPPFSPLQVLSYPTTTFPSQFHELLKKEPQSPLSGACMCMGAAPSPGASQGPYPGIRLTLPAPAASSLCPSHHPLSIAPQLLRLSRASPPAKLRFHWLALVQVLCMQSQLLSSCVRWPGHARQMLFATDVYAPSGSYHLSSPLLLCP